MDAERVDFGMNVPMYLCFVGFDDIEQDGWASYQLTTFRQTIAQIAQYITNLLEGEDLGAISDARVCFHTATVWRFTVLPKLTLRSTSPVATSTEKSREGCLSS